MGSVRQDDANIQYIIRRMSQSVRPVLAAVLIASPFLFGFSDESTPTAIFIAAGVLHLLLTIATRFGAKADTERKSRATSSSSKVRSAADDRAVARGSGSGSGPDEKRLVRDGDREGEAPAAPSTGDRSSARRT